MAQIKIYIHRGRTKQVHEENQGRSEFQIVKEDIKENETQADIWIVHVKDVSSHSEQYQGSEIGRS